MLLSSLGSYDGDDNKTQYHRIEMDFSVKTKDSAGATLPQKWGMSESYVGLVGQNISNHVEIVANYIRLLSEVALS
jgi:hypothetical protein